LVSFSMSDVFVIIIISFFFFFFFKQKTAYEIGLGIPAEPLFRSSSRLLLLRCLLINRRSLLLALRLLWKTPIFPSNSRFPRLCAKCLLKLKRLVSILPKIGRASCRERV